MRRALVVGGSNGIGMAIALELATMHEEVTIVDKAVPDIALPANVALREINLLNNRFEFLSEYDGIDTLVITAGFGRVTRFENIADKEIDNSFQVNAVALTHILHHYYPRMQQSKDFYCAVMGS